MASTIRSSKGITVNGSNFLFGGYAFNASYSVGFNGPSRCSVSFLSENGEYDETALKARIGKNGTKTYDTLKIGEWGPLRMHPLAYSIQEQPSGNVLQVTYYDRSINFLDKYFILLDIRNVPTKAMNEELRTSLDGDKHVIIVGEEFIKDPSQKTVAAPDPNQQAGTIRGEVLYTAADLADAIKAKGSIGGKLPSRQLRILKEFGIIERDKKDPKTGKAINTKRAGYKDQGYLYGFNGSLRSVLSAWGQKLGFTFYWHPTKDKIYLMDLRSGFPYKDMEFCIDAILNKGKNIIGRNYSYSIEDTFSQGASAYFGKDGEEDGKSVPDTKYLLDVLNYPIYKCKTEKYRDAGGEKVWYDYKYIPEQNGATQGNAKEDLRHWDVFLPNRESGVEYLDYIRLVKAAALGGDFFATYVLMKKIANKPFQEGKGSNASPSMGAGSPGPQPGIAQEGDNVAKDHDGEDIETSLNYGVESNSVVDKLFKSSGANAAETKQLLNKQGEGGDWVYGDDCLTARLLNPSLQISSQIKSAYNASAALKSIVQDVYLGDTANPNFWAFGPLQGKTWDPATGPMPDSHVYSLENRIYLARVSDYAISSLLEKPSGNHQFRLLAAIAKAAGRFYVGRGMVTPREFKKRNYVEDNPQIFYRNLDVKDTPLAEIYESLNIVHGAAAKDMPNSLIKNLLMHGSSTCQATAKRGVYNVVKNRESKEKNYRIIKPPKQNKDGKWIIDKQDPCDVYNGTVFGEDDANGEALGIYNSARPTIEQFICSLYTTLHTVDPQGKPAQFDKTLTTTSFGGGGNKWKIVPNNAIPADGGTGWVAPVNEDLFEFVGIVTENGQVKEIQPTVKPTIVVNVNNGEITSIDFKTKGEWSSNIQPVISVRTKDPDGAAYEANIFGNKPEEVEELDSIRKVNLDIRNNTKIEQCCDIDLDSAVMLYDEGEQLVIPDLIKPHVERIGKFGNNPIEFQSDNIQTYLKDSYIVLLPYLYTIGELESKYGILEGAENAGDELDWIVDQVQLGGTFYDWLEKHFEIPTAEDKDGNTFCGPVDISYLMKGDKFEFTHIIRPESAKKEVNGVQKPRWGTLNVREDQFGSPKGQFLTPTLEDLGIDPEECCPGDDKAREKCKKDREENIKKALKELCQENSFDQDKARNGLTVTVAGTAVTDKEGNKVNVSTDEEAIMGYPSIPEGLEKLEVQVDGSGESTTFTVSAKRKVRIFKSAANADKFIKLVGPKLENKLLGN